MYDLKFGYMVSELFTNQEIREINSHRNDFVFDKASTAGGSTDYRGDSICWIEKDSTEIGKFLHGRLSEYMTQLNQKYFLGLRDFEAHMAHYPPGRGYGRHMDSTKSSNRRVVSLVAYLNESWKPDDGGQLKLYLPDAKIVIDPQAPRCVTFLSEEVEHEVMETKTDRWAICCWYTR